MEIKQFDKDSFHVMSITGRIDTHTAMEFEEKVTETIDAGHFNLLLDCSGLNFISSAGLRVLLVAGKKLKMHKRYLVLAALSDPIKEAFDISGFASLFNLYETVEDALNHIQPQSN